MKGSLVTAEEVIREIEKDLHFYRSSGGGVTLSGGEPLMQTEFGNLLRAAILATFFGLPSASFLIMKS